MDHTLSDLWWRWLTDSPWFPSITSSQNNSQKNEPLRYGAFNVEELEAASSSTYAYQLVTKNWKSWLISFNNNESQTSFSTDKKSSESKKIKESPNFSMPLDGSKRMSEANNRKFSVLSTAIWNQLHKIDAQNCTYWIVLQHSGVNNSQDCNKIGT